ncbi:histidine phosphatase family protein [Vibrio vulnificus]|uniref:histidine phosphatase family protein n=1 Tax=Vibrio vulnificus TaxID=672 RepID=UPI00102355F9|nr:histidine phosphatase family protein [Vibrio vulnificus]RZP64496.1 histidine phosphatase family protein [Vibrio vulnificus]RZR17911.1 histidine phosphatase family protein [Vibrio vulnificus]
MRQFFILRHGQTQFNAEQKLQGHCNSPLTEKGQHQALSVGRVLQAHLESGSYRVYSSSLGRALQTAEIVCLQLGYAADEIIADDRLKEFSLGDWEQKTLPELQATLPDLLDEADWYLQAPNGEHYEQVQQRLSQWLDTLPETGRFVVVSHGLTGIVLRGMLLGLDYQQVWQQDLPQDAFFKIVNGQVERVDCPMSEGRAQAVSA